MSHITPIQTKIKSLYGLKEACNEMGLEFIEGAREQGIEGRFYAKQYFKADHLITLKGPYDVGVNAKPDGTYELQIDPWKGHVAREIGRNGGRLIQEYGAANAMIIARRQGLSAIKKREKNGEIKVIINT